MGDAVVKKRKKQLFYLACVLIIIFVTFNMPKIEMAAHNNNLWKALLIIERDTDEMLINSYNDILGCKNDEELVNYFIKNDFSDISYELQCTGEKMKNLDKTENQSKSFHFPEYNPYRSLDLERLKLIRSEYLIGQGFDVQRINNNGKIAETYFVLRDDDNGITVKENRIKRNEDNSLAYTGEYYGQIVYDISNTKEYLKYNEVMLLAQQNKDVLENELKEYRRILKTRFILFLENLFLE